MSDARNPNQRALTEQMKVAMGIECSASDSLGELLVGVDDPLRLARVK
jgi:hypothetical protein